MAVQTHARDDGAVETVSTHKIRLEPLGEEFECAEDETILDAAFRNGFNLVHGCREGRCTACKSFLLEGYVNLKPYSTVALPDSEEEAGYTLLCRAMPESGVVVELMQFDPEDYRLENPIVEGHATVTAIEALTHDITLLAIEVERPAAFGFKPGQYVDLWIPNSDERRSYSIANLPGGDRLEFIIKRYPGGAFSGLLDGSLQVGDPLTFTGPYGSCCLKPAGAAVGCLLVAGGSGMAPMLALLRQLASEGTTRPVTFFYGGRAPRDLFYIDLIEELGAQIEDFQFVPVLSDVAEEESWAGERGFVHDAVDGWLAAPAAMPASEWQIYMAGPQVMIDAASGMLSGRHRVDPASIVFDTFG